jgi:hypothetical protein
MSCLRCDDFLAEKETGTIQDPHVLVECRGKKEDAELELEFRRICDGENPGNQVLPFDIVFADKKTNLAGLQLADLVARPMGLSYVRPVRTIRRLKLSRGSSYAMVVVRTRASGYESVGLMFTHPRKRKAPVNPPRL